MKKRIRELENKRMDFEIKGKRVRTAAFSNSLILLFSLCCAGEARAAKMCLVAPATYSWNAANYIWAVGTGCGNAAKDTSDPTALCSTRVASGVAFCARDTGTDDGFQAMENWSGYDANLKGMTGTGTSSGLGMARFCFCRMSWPKQGAWVFLVDYGSASDCASYCADYCANGAVGSAAFRSAVLGQPGF
ncbi:MAG: hypothetical protein LBL46_03530 [Rickettsiales bacterium]|jgi:hypothetical protein|nr:hypothetical protein [Rickettsiales bacterium]